MYLKLAWRNIWRNKRRTLITLTAIGFAVFLACLMQSSQFGTYERMINNAVRFHTGFIQLHRQGYWENQTINNSLVLNDSVRQAFEQVPGVKTLVPRLESFALAAYGDKTRGAQLIGYDPQTEDALTGLKKRLVKGEYLQKGDNAVLVAEGLADYLGINLGDTLVLMSQGYQGTNAAALYKVGGILKFPIADLNNQIIYLPLEEAQNFYGAPDMVTALAVDVASDRDIEKVLAGFREKADPSTYEVMDWRQMMPGLVQSMELDYASGSILLYVLYAVIGFSLFGSILMMTSERMYEFGVMISVGMHRLRLQAIIYLEIALLGLTGVLLGIALSILLLSYLHANPIPLGAESQEAYERFGVEPVLPFSLDPQIFLNQAWTILVLVILLGLYPVFVIRRLKVINAIKP
jgi:putative ABC transport system permease protein